MNADTTLTLDELPGAPPIETLATGNGLPSQPEIPAVVLPTLGAGGASLTLSAREARALRRVLRPIKAARADSKSKDSDVARQALERQVILGAYVAGFFDGKGLNTVSLNPGFNSIYQSQVFAMVDPDAQLDEAIKNLEQLVSFAPTRIVPALIRWGIALIVVGVAAKTGGEALKEADKAEGNK